MFIYIELNLYFWKVFVVERFKDLPKGVKASTSVFLPKIYLKTN
jgi:hypothetical protein